MIQMTNAEIIRHLAEKVMGCAPAPVRRCSSAHIRLVESRASFLVYDGRDSDGPFCLCGGQFSGEKFNPMASRDDCAVVEAALTPDQASAFAAHMVTSRIQDADLKAGSSLALFLLTADPATRCHAMVTVTL